MSDEIAQEKDQLQDALERWLEPGESMVAGAGAMTGSPVWGPTSMMAKWCYIGVTDHRVVVLSLSRWSTRVKGVWFEDPRGDVTVGAVALGDPWSSFVYQRPDGTSLRMNFHRFWRQDMEEVLRALGAHLPA
jgi:hypothetical protein